MCYKASCCEAASVVCDDYEHYCDANSNAMLVPW